MYRSACLAGLLLAVCGSATAAELGRIDRHVRKEPAYTSKSPRYCLLVIGREAADRVWLVKDGNVLYVDRNGNGDLTEPGKKVVASKGGSAEDGYQFEAGEVSVGGKTHYRLHVSFQPLRKMNFGQFGQRADMQAALKKDPQVDIILAVRLDVRAPHLKAKGYVSMLSGGFDLNGPLVPASKASDAPILHFDGPLEINFNDTRPPLRRNRAVEFNLVVGTPGLGAGTFTGISYDETIPSTSQPQISITFPGAKPGAAAVKKLYELKERC
jgi:hypothetical protein